MTTTMDRNQPRVKLEGFELSPPPIKQSAPTPQDILRRFSQHTSQQSIHDSITPDTPNENLFSNSQFTQVAGLPRSGPRVSNPNATNATPANSNANSNANTNSNANSNTNTTTTTTTTATATEEQHIQGQASTQNLATTFGSYQPFRQAFGGQGSTFDADLFALTSGVEDCEMAGTVGFEGGSGGGTGHQGGHYQQQQQQQQGGQRRSENNNWEESALAITGMFADSQLRMKNTPIGMQQGNSNGQHQFPPTTQTSGYGHTSLNDRSPSMIGNRDSNFGFQHGSAPPNQPIIHDGSSYLDNMFEHSKSDVKGLNFFHRPAIPFVFQGQGQQQQQQQQQQHGSHRIGIPGSPISTQGYSSQSAISMLGGSSATPQSGMASSFVAGAAGPGTVSGDEWHEPQDETSAFVDSPLMDGPPPRKMSKSGIDEVVGSASFFRSPTWRRASFAENGVPSSSWNTSRAPGMTDPGVLRRSSTGQSSMIRPEGGGMQDIGVPSPHSNSGSGGSVGLDRFLVPSRQSAPSSRSPQLTNGTSDISPSRRMDQVEEEESRSAVLADDNSPSPRQIADMMEAAAVANENMGGKGWRRGQKGSIGLNHNENAMMGDEDAEDDDSPTALQTITASDNAEARRSRRRLSHNEVERRRREVINEKIQELEMLLPAPMVASAIAARDAEGADEEEHGLMNNGRKSKAAKKKGKKATVPEKLCKGTVLCLTVELVKQMSSAMDSRHARERELEQTIQQLRIQMASGGNGNMLYPNEHDMGGGMQYGHNMTSSPYISMDHQEALRSLEELSNQRIPHFQQTGGGRLHGSAARSLSRGRKRSSSQMAVVEEMHAEGDGGFYGQY